MTNYESRYMNIKFPFSRIIFPRNDFLVQEILYVHKVALALVNQTRLVDPKIYI
jgi:hypothetical protein